MRMSTITIVIKIKSVIDAAKILLELKPKVSKKRKSDLSLKKNPKKKKHAEGRWNESEINLFNNQFKIFKREFKKYVIPGRDQSQIRSFAQKYIPKIETTLNSIPNGAIVGKFETTNHGIRYYPGEKKGNFVSYPNGEMYKISFEDKGMMSRKEYIREIWNNKKVGDKIMVFYSRKINLEADCFNVHIKSLNKNTITVYESGTDSSWDITKEGFEEQFYLSWWK